MKRKIILASFIFIALLVLACTNKNIDSFSGEKGGLTNEIAELEKKIEEKDEKIQILEDKLSELKEERNQLIKSIDMIRFSSYARLNDYDDSFDNLKNIYKINSSYTVKDDWYIINEDNFEIELLGYANAKKVDWYILRLESNEGPILVFTDTDKTNGWVYSNKNISQIINKHEGSSTGKFTYEPYFVLYTEVTLEDGNIIRTSRLPIYNE